MNILIEILKNNKYVILSVFIILLVTFAVYYPALDNDFVNWDDDRYVTENTIIQDVSLENTTKLFSEFYFVMYIPITLLTYSFDYWLVELNPFWYHLHNLLIHLANTLLVFIFISNFTQPATSRDFVVVAAISAILFGLQSLHVESVVWISERKDVLFTFFFLLSSVLYLDYVRTDNRKYFYGAIFRFLFSLMSKGQAVTLSVSLLAYDYFLDRKLLSKKVILEKIPFLLLSLLFGIIAIFAINTEEPFADTFRSSITEEVSRPFFENLLYANYGYIQNIVKLIAPYELSAIYPYPEKIDGEIPMQFFFYPIGVLAIIALFFYMFKRNKYVVFAIAFFTFNIVLVLQIFSYQSYILTDRYSYVPSIGLNLLIAYGFMKLIEINKNLKIPLLTFALFYLSFVSYTTYKQTDVWQNSITLWEDINEKYPKVIVAYYNKGTALQDLGENEKAIEAYTTAIYIDPMHLSSYSNRGLLLAQSGKINEALQDFDKVEEIDSNFLSIYTNRGNTKAILGKYEEAIVDYNKIISKNPNATDAILNRAIAKILLNQNESALDDLEKLIQMNLKTERVYFNISLANKQLGKYELALQNIDESIRLNSGSISALQTKAQILDLQNKSDDALRIYQNIIQQDANFIKNEIRKGQVYEARKEIEAAMDQYTFLIRIAPKNTDARIARAVLFGKRGQLDRAIVEFSEIIKIDPNNATAYVNRGFAYGLKGNRDQAFADYEQAIVLNPENASAYYNRALLFMKRNQKQKACENLKRAAELGLKEAIKQYQNTCE